MDFHWLLSLKCSYLCWEFEEVKFIVLSETYKFSIYHLLSTVLIGQL